MTREKMEFDVVIVGAGPSGLCAAIRLAQLSKQENTPLSICILEKSAAIGDHILSGAVLNPRALNELIPDWQNKNPPLHTPVTEDQFLWLSEKKFIRLPTPLPMHNQGNFIISLSQFCRFLATFAESLEINIFPGFAASEIIYENNRVIGIATGDQGLDKEGQPKAQFQAGIELHAKQIIFAEGCRGSLTQTLFSKFNLRDGIDPQTYALGIKEIWEIPEDLHQSGLVMHSIGWPLDNKTYGGSFIYHHGKNKLAIGFVAGLDYENTYLDIYETFQIFKTHPLLKPLLEKGRRLAYGARTLNEGGFQSIPKLTFPGGLIVGCAAGFLNVPRLKGIDNAMKSGMLAAESIFSMFKNKISDECTDYSQAIKTSWIWKELYHVRNIRPAMRWGLLPGLSFAAIDTYVFRGKWPFTFHIQKPDHLSLKFKEKCTKMNYPKHDNQITFDLTTSLFLTNSQYDENQPCHLKLKNKAVPIDINLKIYDGPEQRYCPAGVYEIIYNLENKPYLQINAANCIHCKACDIKDPTQNIVWTTPEGGSGPQYEMM